jgi:16S rRNA (cytosine1402-N4)-methyltransferase
MNSERDNTGTSSGNYHTPVLLDETIEALRIDPAGVYVDCTFGGGGHSAAILSKLGPTGRLVAFDQDADARRNLPDEERLLFIPHNFRHLQRFLRLHRITVVNGITADLGVSSHQFDSGDRGFSIRFDADLDMRMDKRQESTAATVLANFSESQLHLLFERYGEVTNAKTLARTIVAARKNLSLKTIADLKNAIHPVVKGNPNKYLAQVFQALRIEVNQELESLKELLTQVQAVLAPGGRVAIITFHSLEDRLVKQFFREGSFEAAEHDEYGNKKGPEGLKLITRKPITPGPEELKINPRSRSAKLRVAEK